MEIDEVQNATLEELTAFYNANAKTPVEEFADFPTAAKRVKALINAMKRKENGGEPKAPKAETLPLTPEEEAERQAEISARRSAAVKASWDNEETAKARSARTGVEVDGVYYRSVTAAYDALGLPGAKCLAHRAELRKRTLEDPNYQDEEYGMVWKIVPYRQEKTEKPPQEEATGEASEPTDAEASSQEETIETETV